MPKVKTCVKAGPGQVQIIERDLPGPAAGQALVRTTLSTVCGSDLHMIDDFAIMPAGQPQGHEAIGGVVEAVGDGVSRIKPGDQRGDLLPRRLRPLSRVHGGRLEHAPHVSRAAQRAVRLSGRRRSHIELGGNVNMTVVPESVCDQQALFSGDIMSTGFAAIERARLKPGQTVAIFAQGPVGLCATAAAKFYGASRRSVTVESVPERVAMSKRLGADDNPHYRPQDAVERIKELTKNQGLDVAIEALGREETPDACLKVIRHGGSVVSRQSACTRTCAIVHDPDERDLQPVHLRAPACAPVAPSGSTTWALGLVQGGKGDLTARCGPTTASSARSTPSTEMFRRTPGTAL